MTYIVSDGQHCSRCQQDLQGSESTVYGYKVCKSCALIFKKIMREVPEWDLFKIFFAN